ncbi:preprotein translocase subunit SecG [Candidatus Izimaplasma bacterium ZiA1]|uniref:preprotein translocase subunit SecG n=1 Tax=Candidatus Izimoplasma sp. ZiA1 TaxID=2024899 RepID=UPI000BAA68A5|nr:preprotein translocase subunit SecG [Candidatus Izimaplasma bacterium ZiA1]
MQGIQNYLLLIISVLLITLVVVQSSKDSIDNAFSGEKSELFNNQKQRGFELIMARTTMVTSALFIAVSVWAMIS